MTMPSVAQKGRRQSTKALRPLLYLAYGLFVTVLFIYLLFPGERVKAFIVAQANSLVPHVSISVGDVGVGFPMTVQLEGVTWFVDGNPVMRSEQVRVRPHLMSLVQKKSP